MGSDFNGEKEQRRKYHSAESLLRVVGVGGGGEKQWAVFCTCTNKQVTKNVIILCSKYRDIFRNGPVRKYFSPKIRGGGRNEKKTFFYLRLVSVILVNNLDPSVNSFTIVLLLMVILKSAHPTVLYIKYF